MVECRCCGSRRTNALFSVRLDGADPIASYARSLGENLKAERTLFNCESCSSKFFELTVSSNVLAEFYEQSDSPARWVQRTPDEGKENKILNEIRRLVKSESTRVLDFGCNDGQLLCDLKDLVDFTAYGFDLSRHATSAFVQRGIALADDQEYDVVLAFDIIEHFASPGDLLEKLKKRVKIDGHIVLLTGNCNSFSSRLAADSWWYYRYLDHITFPSEAWIRNQSGLRLKKSLKCFNKISYDRGCKARFKTLIKILLHKLTIGRFKYTGDPALTNDHFLWVLQRVD